MKKVKKTRFALVSYPVKDGDVDQNLKQIEYFLSAYTLEEADIFIFGETNLTGLSPQSILEKKLPPTAATVTKVIELAGKYQVSICSGLIEEAEGKYYLSHFICNAEGIICWQRKLFPGTPQKQDFYSSGRKIISQELFNVQAALMPCADFLLPEPFMQAGLVDTSLIISPTDCFEADKVNLDIVPTLAKARDLDLRADIIVVFNSSADLTADAKKDKCLSFLAYNHSGKELLFKTKRKEESVITFLDLEIKSHAKMWGGFKFRQDYLSRD